MFISKVYFEEKIHRSLLAEFIGSALLLMTIASSSAILQPMHAAIAIGSFVAAFTFVGGGINNPAICTGVHIVRLRRMLAARRPGAVRSVIISWCKLVTVEFIGAFVGALLGYGMLGNEVQRNGFPAPQPNEGLENQIPRAILVESVFTFQLVYVTLFTCVAKEFDRVNVNRFLGPSLGLTVFVAVSVAGPLSGASLNPAVALSLDVVQCIFQVGASANGSCRPLSFIWLYVIVGLLAGFVAGIAFLLASNEVEPSEFDEMVCVIDDDHEVEEEVAPAPVNGASGSVMSEEFKTKTRISFDKSVDEKTRLSNDNQERTNSLLPRRRSSARIRRSHNAGMHTLADFE